ncbi:TonB-dependent receptor [Sphingobium sufflavum]|nr:TonB-dependent receptor [Sphingobium sufflavum]
MQPTIRGVGNAVVTAGGSSNVGIYADGFYSPNPLAADFQLLNVQSIQVLKGPQGTLFGRNTTGGAILVTSARPAKDTAAVAELSYGSFNALRAQGYMTTGLSDNLAVDLEGSYSRGDGYLRNIIASGPRHPGAYENWSVRAGVAFDLSDSIDVLLRYSHQRVDDASNVALGTLRQNGITYAPLQGLPEQLPAGLVATNYREVAVTNSAVPYFHFDADIFQATVGFDMGSADLTSYTQYRIDKSDIVSDNDQTAADINYNRIPVTGRTFTQEFILASKPGGRLQWTAGLFYFNYVDQLSPLGLGTSSSNVYAEGASHSRTQSIAAFADFTYEAIDNLFLTVGARYSHDRFDRGAFRLSLVNPAFDLINQSFAPLDTDRVTPRAVIRYAVDNATSVYASYTKGYKAPLVDVIAGGIVRPEQMDAYEIGIKHATRQLSLNLSSWYYDYKDLQISIYKDNLSQILNAATARIYGVEGDVTYRPTSDLTITAGGALVDGRYKSFPNGSYYDICGNPATCGTNYGFWTLFPSNSSGKRMQRSPTFTASLGASYGIDVAKGRLNLSGNLYHSSQFFYDLSEQFRQGSYNLLGLRAEWTDPSGNIKLAVYGENLLGEEYTTQVAYHAPSIGVGWAAPATFGASIRYAFGK